jgi:hypothetical protein
MDELKREAIASIANTPNVNIDITNEHTIKSPKFSDSRIPKRQ